MTDEITIEQDNEPENLRDSAEAVKKLKEDLKTCKKERQEYLDGWQRAQADYANMKKDEDRERARFVKFSTEMFVKELLPALDSFHTAFGNKEAWEKVDLNWRMGVQHIYMQFRGVLEKHGVTLIEPKVGEPFDPKSHQSIEIVTVGAQEQDHTVVEVLQKGYALYGKILEAAKVKVGEFAKQ